MLEGETSGRRISILLDLRKEGRSATEIPTAISLMVAAAQEW